MFLKNKKKEPQDIREVLAFLKELESKFKNLESELEEMKRESRFAIRGIGIVRFNPFSEVGGNQSFSLALLDGDKNGVVITGYYSREGSNVYSKEIKGGSSSHPLSEEEKEAIIIASEREDKKK